VGIAAKGLAAVESMLFAKYQMYRNVYWHHAVRSATAMYKRIVERALERGAVRLDELGNFTDEALLHAIESGSADPMLSALRERRLFKRAYEAPAASMQGADLEWIAEDRPRTRAAEAKLAKSLGLTPEQVLLDYPAKTQMLGLDLLVEERDGSVRHLTDSGAPGAIQVTRLADELYRSARWLRVFTAVPVDASAAVAALVRS
jgi:HD superfamily phosphohydrolase